MHVPGGVPVRRGDESLPLRLAGARQRPLRVHARSRRRYRGRVSGPLLDRIDLRIEVPAVAPEVLAGGTSARGAGSADAADSSAHARARVALARDRQLARQGKPNARLAAREVEAHCALDQAGGVLLGRAMARLSLSARAYHRILKVARTIADLDALPAIAPAHVAEAIAYRRYGAE